MLELFGLEEKLWGGKSELTFHISLKLLPNKHMWIIFSLLTILISM